MGLFGSEEVEDLGLVLGVPISSHRPPRKFDEDKLAVCNLHSLAYYSEKMQSDIEKCAFQDPSYSLKEGHMLPYNGYLGKIVGRRRV